MGLSPLNDKAAAKRRPKLQQPGEGEEAKLDPKRSEGMAPLDALDTSRYSPPKQDITRDEYHRWFRDAQQHADVDAGGEGLKNAVSNFENSWYVAAALTMTVGFAFLMFQPQGQHPDISCGIISCDQVAIYIFVALSLFGTINSVLGVWWAGHMVPQVSWHPAAYYSKFLSATLNTTLGHSQQFSKIAIKQLVLALVPLCYLNFGVVGLILSVVSIIYMYFQLKTWEFLMKRMRKKYQDGLDNKCPEIDDVAGLPHQYCQYPHMGDWGWVFCQLPGSICFMFRWLYPPAGGSSNKVIIAPQRKKQEQEVV